MSMKALERHLQPLMPYLQADGVTEICINRPQEVFVEKNGRFVHCNNDELDYGFLHSLAALVAESNYLSFPSAMVSGSLPGGERIQFMLPPVCETGKIVCSIRRQNMRDLTLDDYEENQAFNDVVVEQSASPIDEELRYLHKQKKIPELIKFGIQSRKNILISGGTGTGKTTFLNACLKLIPENERIISIEDSREVIVCQKNVAKLLFNENERAQSALAVFKACLRLRPDRIILSELRGNEVWSFLRAINSGHPGSLSTVHADSPDGAFQQLVFMMQQAGSSSSEDQIRRYIQSIIHIVIQLQRDPKSDRFMYVSEVWLSD